MIRCINELKKLENPDEEYLKFATEIIFSVDERSVNDGYNYEKIRKEMITKFKIVSQTKLYGVMINWKLSLSEMTLETTKVRKYNAFTHGGLLGDPYVTMFTKMVIVKSYVFPQMLYGSELLAAQHYLESMKKVQVLINRMGENMLGVIVDGHMHGKPDNMVLNLDMGMQPIVAIGEGSMMRALQKYKNESVHGYMAMLIQNQVMVTNGNQTWSQLALKYRENLKVYVQVNKEWLKSWETLIENPRGFGKLCK